MGWGLIDYSISMNGRFYSFDNGKRTVTILDKEPYGKIAEDGGEVVPSQINPQPVSPDDIKSMQAALDKYDLKKDIEELKKFVKGAKPDYKIYKTLLCKLEDIFEPSDIPIALKLADNWDRIYVDKAIRYEITDCGNDGTADVVSAKFPEGVGIYISRCEDPWSQVIQPKLKEPDCLTFIEPPKETGADEILDGFNFLFPKETKTKDLIPMIQLGGQNESGAKE